MTDPLAPAGDSSRDHWRRIAIATVILVLFRSAVFMIWPQAHFDSDQAVHGLMAKHIAELRAFPVFMYGQSYLLAVEAWLAAPLFAVAGASVFTLKLPLLLMNVAIALLLLRIFYREVGLRPAMAVAASLFFVLPAPGTAAQLVEASGENVEPFLYVVLLWLTRNRPNWGGIILGIGFLNREFTIYGLAALLTIEAGRGVLFTREGVKRRLIMFRGAAEVWLLVTWLKQYSSAAGPNTSLADLHRLQPDNVRELLNHICIDPQTMLTGIWNGLTTHLPRLFGVAIQPLAEFAIESRVRQGVPGGWLVLAVLAVVAVTRITMRLVAERRWRSEYDPCLYLVLIGLFSFGANTILRCGVVGVMRYDLLSIIGATGVAAWYLRIERLRPLLVLWIVLVAAWAGSTGVAHAKLWAEYVSHPQPGVKRLIIHELEAQGIRYAYADYWLAYYITFLTNERIIVAATDSVRVREHNRIVDAHRDEAVLVSRSSCPGGRQIVRGVYLCSPPAAASGSGNPPGLAVPRQRSSDAFAQAHAGRVAQFGPRAADVEGAALGEEINPPPIERGLDRERRADDFAERARGPERPDRQVQPRRRHVCLRRDQFGQLVQRRHLAAGEDVGAAGCGGNGAAQTEALDQVVDIGQVIEDAAVAEDDEAAAGDAAEEFQQAAVARSVDARRPRDNDLDPGVARGVSCDALAFEFGLLINVARTERRVFVGGGMLDVAVDTDGAAVHDPPCATRLCRFDHRPHRRRVYGAVLLVAKPRLPVDGGDVIDHLDPLRRALQRIRVPQIPPHNLDRAAPGV
jgi:hypothetical protein